MYDMKYITYKQGYDKIILFPSSDSHDDMVEKLGIERADLLGAGSVCLYVDEPYCYGSSLTLGRKSREEDTAILRVIANL